MSPAFLRRGNTNLNSRAVVFNTEAHPFIAPAEKPVYGSGKLRPASEFEPFKATSGPLPLVSSSPKLPTKIPDQ